MADRRSRVQQAEGPGAARLAWPRPVIGVALASWLLVLDACDRDGAHPPQAGDRAVATVGGQTIWASDVRREAAAQGLIGENETLAIDTDLFHRMLDEVVDQKLLAGEALKRRLDADPLARRRLAAARDQVLGDLLVESVVAQAVNDNAVRGLYAEQLKLAKPAVSASLVQARPQIVRFLTYDRIKALLEQLRDQSVVRVLVGPASDPPVSAGAASTSFQSSEPRSSP